jgi:hypothetical protein
MYPPPAMIPSSGVRAPPIADASKMEATSLSAFTPVKRTALPRRLVVGQVELGYFPGFLVASARNVAESLAEYFACTRPTRFPPRNR